MSKKPQNWSLTVDRHVAGKPVYAIRRWNAGKLERYPAAKYAKFRDDREQLELLVTRLNYTAERKAKAAHEIRHAHYGEEFLAGYLEWLTTQVPKEKGAKQEMSYLRRHFLTFFVNKLGLMSPGEWHEIHETKWASYLLGPDAPRSAKTKRDIVSAANRFMRYLHKRRPDEVPLLVFEPLTPAKLDSVEGQRELDGEVRESHFIPPADWKRIEAALPPHLEPFVQFGYRYGLRRQELVGLKSGDVRKGHLSVERQLERLGVYVPLKGKEKRTVEHWYASATDAYRWLEAAQKQIVHPRTLSEYFDALMVTLKLPYTLHDLRHSFITRALRDHNPRDVQLAAGHKHISTTMGYAHDDRDTSDEVFVPESA